MNREEIRLAGSGGQGIILATVILAEAAVLSGRYTAQSQAYGPEARGGACKAETLISDSPIGFTKVRKPTFLMALTQTALDMYIAETDENCTVLVDSTLQLPEETKAKAVVRLPILDIARNTVGRLQTANIVAVGCINRILGIADSSVIREAVMRHIPKGTDKLNMKALEEGIALAESWLEEKRG